jgi:hypothetical protein
MYDIEIKPCAKSGWYTPEEARRHYGKYGRDGITVHWWGDGTGASNHDNIVNYLNGRGAKGEAPTANYVLSDIKITNMVSPDNVAWTSGNGNATTIGVETQPTLGNEGYKKWGWLVWQLEQRYSRRLALYRHSNWMSTACPGTISLDRIRQEADKWARGEYNPTPPTPVPPATAQLEWSTIPAREYRTRKQPTMLWNFDKTSWAAITAVKPYNQGDPVNIYGQCVNKTLGATYLVTKYSYDKKIANGFNIVDMELVEQPAPTPLPPEPVPEPPVPDPAEWEKNLRDVDDTKYWITEDCQLWDIAGNKPAEGKFAKSFKKGDEFVAGATTFAHNMDWRITQYSFDKRFYNGLPINKLTLTPPSVPDVPPVPQPPTPTPEPDISWIKRAIQAILDFFKIKFQ